MMDDCEKAFNQWYKKKDLGYTLTTVYNGFRNGWDAAIKCQYDKMEKLLASAISSPEEAHKERVEWEEKDAALKVRR